MDQSTAVRRGNVSRLAGFFGVNGETAVEGASDLLNIEENPLADFVERVKPLGAPFIK
jgi:hypothetical protein